MKNQRMTTPVEGRSLCAEEALKAPKISVIMPVYNVEGFLPQCLKTLDAQTFRDFELIAVNDGATDHSPEILREYAATRPHVRVIDKKNEGQAKARNLGLQYAQAEFVCFIDSDDFVSPLYLQRLYETQQETGADIAYCYYYYHFADQDFNFEYPFRYDTGVMDREEALQALLHDLQVQSLPWNKLFRKSLFTEYEIQFPTMCFEDLAIMHEVFWNANKVAILDEPLYYYVQHSSSTLGNMNAGKINDFIRALAIVRMAFEKKGIYEDFRGSYKALTRKTAACCFVYVMKMHWARKRMRGTVSDLRRVSRAIRHYQADEFGMTLLFDSLPDVLTDSEETVGKVFRRPDAF